MPHATARPVDDALRVARFELRCTRVDLATKLGLSRKTIGRLERGRPTVWHVVLRRALDDLVREHLAAHRP